MRLRLFLLIAALAASVALTPAAGASEENETAGSRQLRFSGLDWRVDDPDAVVIERDGVEVLFMKSGSAWLTDKTLSTGVIEVDIWPHDGPAFAGIGFHARDLANLELVYLRIHKSGSWDAVQYCPRFNSIDGWQLYTGNSFTAAASWQSGDPVRLRLEVAKRSARIYVGDDDSQPLLTVPLKTGAAGSGIMLWSRIGNELSDFRFERREVEETRPASDERRSATTENGRRWRPITSWQISDSIDAAELPPMPASLAELPPGGEWQAVDTEPDGLLNISRWRTKRHLGRRPINNSTDAVIARTVIDSPLGDRQAMRLAYSDDAQVFLNGVAVFAGTSGFRSRHPTYLGLATSHDIIYLDLREGENELVIVISELFGGWGFRAELLDLD